MQKSKTGIVKSLIYIKIGIHILYKYRKKMNFKTICGASRLLFAFYHNKIMVLKNTYKLHLYLPAYPTPAFFTAVESKIFSCPPKPISIVFSITKECGGKCKHCYQKMDKGSDCSLDILTTTSTQILNTGVAFVNLEGGDAFLKFNELCAVLDVFCGKAEVWVNTTGMNVTKEKLHILKDKGIYGLMVSLHGVTADTHDEFVGISGVFDQALQTLSWCNELSIGSAINTVFEQDRLKNDELPEMMNLAKKYHCGFVQLIHPKRAGLWLTNKKLNEEDTFVKKYVKKEYTHYNSFLCSSYPALAVQMEEETPNRFGCTSGGIDRFYIGASGELQPCEFLNISFGNVNEEDFDVLFKRMRAAFPYPCENWLCVTQAENISQLKEKYQLKILPLPYYCTKELMDNWDRGKATKLYKKMGIYEHER